MTLLLKLFRGVFSLNFRKKNIRVHCPLKKKKKKEIKNPPNIR